MDLTFEQEVKLQLVALSEYLQCKPLSDLQIRLYAADLIELGPEGLKKAIALLKQDPDVWAGKFPLPAKLKQYVYGNIEDKANEGARLILSFNDQKGLYTLEPFLLQVAKDYGIGAILNRPAANTPVIFAQLRNSIKSRLRADSEKRVELDAIDASEPVGFIGYGVEEDSEDS